jgi:hypothetical protein
MAPPNKRALHSRRVSAHRVIFGDPLVAALGKTGAASFPMEILRDPNTSEGPSVAHAPYRLAPILRLQSVMAACAAFESFLYLNDQQFIYVAAFTFTRTSLAFCSPARSLAKLAGDGIALGYTFKMRLAGGRNDPSEPASRLTQ